MSRVKSGVVTHARHRKVIKKAKGYYAARSRAHALRIVVDMMLAHEDPYQALFAGRGKYRQQMDAADE